MRRGTPILALALAAGLPGRAPAQATCAIAGMVRDAEAQAPLVGARLVLDGGRLESVTDARGAFRLRELPAGWHRVTVAAIGFRGVTRDSVLVRSGQTTALDFLLAADPVGLTPLEVIAEPVDSVLDPLAVADQQRLTAEDLRRLPVSSVDEALALSAGAVGESYRGGRLGQQSFILDGLGLKNQLDASTGGNGLRLPPGLLSEAALITNGFSARYGQAISAMVNLSTRDGADRWGAHADYETDRPLPDGWDYGLDRVVLAAEGPVGAARVLAVADLSGRLDADPVNAPAPADPRDPRHRAPWLQPHAGGEQADLALKLTLPLGARQTVRLLAVRSADQRLLADPLYKYDSDIGDVRRTTGTLLSGHLQRLFPASGITADLRLGYFRRDFIQGSQDGQPDYRFGAWTGAAIPIVGEALARAQDTVAARAPIPGYRPPAFSERSPWGVPAFFLGQGARGNLGWNRFGEFRSRLDLVVPAGPMADFSLGAEFASQRVRTFQRTLAYRPVGPGVPAASAATFSPASGAGWAELQVRTPGLALTGGLRYDQFTGRDDLPGQSAATRRAISPRFSASSVLHGATLVASFGRFLQAPDYQYLIDAAFDDTVRTGRFRQGNPGLGFESSTQYEFSLRLRPTPVTAVRVNLYLRRLDGLVGSVPFGTNPDSSFFGNTDAGTVKGTEVILERQFARGWGARLSYTLQQATTTSSDAFFLRHALRIDPVTGDTIFPSRVEFPLDFDRRHGLVAIVTGEAPAAVGPRLLGVRPLGGLAATVVFRLASGLPYSLSDPGADTLVGVPNDRRLPATHTLDLLVRRPVRFGRVAGSLYLDARNLLNRRNLVSVRRDTGTPGLTTGAIQALADSAYRASPDPIPYESPRYRRWADLDGNGWVEGPGELQPLFLAAARDASQPLFAYGAPRLLRLGVELGF